MIPSGKKLSYRRNDKIQTVDALRDKLPDVADKRNRGAWNEGQRLAHKEERLAALAGAEGSAAVGVGVIAGIMDRSLRDRIASVMLIEHPVHARADRQEQDIAGHKECDRLHCLQI
jgi:hypothetical protein